MQITTLNKIINLFLVGSLAIVVLFLLLYGFHDALINKFIKEDLIALSSSLQIILLILFFPVGIFVGTIIEGISDAFRPFTKLHNLPFNHKSLWLSFFRNKEDFHDFKAFYLLFKNVLKESSVYYKGYDVEDQQINKEKIELAAAIFFKTANPETISYVIQHYSSYILATNYLLILLITLPFIFFIDIDINLRLLILFSIIICLYSLIHFTIERYCFTYYTLYRHAYLVVREHLLDKIEPKERYNDSNEGKESSENEMRPMGD